MSRAIDVGLIKKIQVSFFSSASAEKPHQSMSKCDAHEELGLISR
jgi:hypothetical protein